jgi:nicotinamide riboside kinase
MKILVTGTFCAGKTTLVTELGRAIINSTVIYESARDLLHHFPSIDFALPQVRDYLLVSQLLREKIAETSSKVTICDTGVESNLSHDIVLRNTKANIDLLNKFQHQRYDAVLFCDHREISFSDDGERLTNLDLRELLAQTIKDYLLKQEYKFTEISGNPNKRLLDSLQYLVSLKILYPSDIEWNDFNNQK